MSYGTKKTRRNGRRPDHKCTLLFAFPLINELMHFDAHSSGITRDGYWLSPGYALGANRTQRGADQRHHRCRQH